MRQVQSALMTVLLLTTVTTAVHGQTRGGFDAAGRLLMHGTPRFVLGVYDSGGSFSTDPALWEQQIFSPTGDRGLQGFPLNVYLNYWMGGMPIGPTNALLDVLHNHGMMYLQTGNCFDTGSWTRDGPGSFSIMGQTYVQQFAQHPAALGYYIMDECVDALIPETQQHQQQLETWDPQGLTFAATLAAGYRDPSLWTNAADVLGVDPYPLYGPEPAVGYTHFIVADFVSKLRAVAKPNRPVWSVLQFFKFTSDSRVPTADELRAHAVMSIVEGAQGIFWWDIGTNGIRSGTDAATVSTAMSNLKALTIELSGLEPALLADPAPGALIGNSTKFADPVAGRIAQLQHNIAVEWLFSRIQWYQAELAALQAGDTSKSGGLLNGTANVRTLTKVANGVGFVFAYNYTNASQPVTFTWYSAPTSVTESKTGQAFPLNGASWSDTFGPYQARIYVVHGAGAPPVGRLTVTNTSNSAAVAGSLPWAVQQANSNPGLDYIYFNIPGPGVHVITLSTTLFLNDQVVIDGKTQPGYAGSPLVYVVGTSSVTSLFLLQNASSGSTLQGLGLYGYTSNGLTILSSSIGNWIQDNYIGFYADGVSPVSLNSSLHPLTLGLGLQSSFNTIRGNTISGVDNAIVIGEDPAQTWSGTAYKTNSIQGNRIGTNPAGDSGAGFGNTGDGLFLGAGARENFLGPDNVLSGNASSGVELFHPTVIGNLVFRNAIGVNAAGTAAIPNHQLGVLLANGANGNAVGGPFGGNVISANTFAGVSLGAVLSPPFTGAANGNWVQYNIIGLNLSQSAAPGAQDVGVSLSNGSTQNDIEGNVLAGNVHHGAQLFDVVTNSVSNNWIGMSSSGVARANGGFGVYLHNASNNFATGNAFGVNTLGAVGADGTSCCNVMAFP